MSVAALGGVLILLAAGLTPSVAAAPTCIYIVQGLPGRTVSVEVDGESVADDMAAGKVSEPIPVKSGTRTLTVTEDGETLVTTKVKLPKGSNSEIVVHLPASPTGDPVITRFDNMLDAVQSGRAAFAVGHVAAAGPIDIRVDEEVFLANVATGEFLYEVVPAMTYNIDIVASGQSEPLLGPQDVMAEPEMLTWLFAIGVPGESLTVVKHVIALSEGKDSKRPTDIGTGTGGQAAELMSRNGP
jgi:hypothetical protein